MNLGLRRICSDAPSRRALRQSGGSFVRGSVRSGGFTLIEILIASALMAIILVSGYVCLEAAISTRKLIEPRIEIIQNARVAMALMTADLRSACPLSPDYDFLGTHRMLGDVQADNIDFATHNYTPARRGEGDFCQTSLFVEPDPESGDYTLWRRRNPRIGLNPLAGGSREEIATGLRGVKFEYYDGIDWYDTWGDVEQRGKAQTSRKERYNLDGLPEAVRITLWFDSNPRRPKTQPSESGTNQPPLVFQTVARLNLADVPQNDESGGGAQGGAPANAGQPFGATPQ